MVKFQSTILKFAEQGEKTGWTYISIPAAIAQQLKSDNKKSFRVKGKLDNYTIKSIALLPMGGGDFIMAINATMRKAIGKTKGAQLQVQLQIDDKPLIINAELLLCLADDPAALAAFKKMPPSHQFYYSKWIESAKTNPTREKRISMTVVSVGRGIDFATMLRTAKKDKEQ